MYVIEWELLIIVFGKYIVLGVENYYCLSIGFNLCI